MSAEKINLFELDIDIEALTKSTAKSLQEVKSLEEGQKSLKKSTADLKKEIKDYSSMMKEAKKSNDTKAYKELETVQKGLKMQYNELSTAQVKNQTSLKAARKEYNLGLKMMNSYGKQSNKNLLFIDKTDGSINQLSAALSKNKSVYRSLSKEQRENSEVGKKLNSIIQKQDAEYKQLNVGIGNTGVMVGTYKDQIKEAAMEMGFFGKQKAQFMGTMAPFIPLLKGYKNEWSGVIDKYKGAAAGTKGYTIAQKAATIGTNITSASLKLLKVALISTGIGAIVVLLGSLVAWFSKSQKGIDMFSQGLASAKAFVDVFMDRLIKLGGAIVKLFSFDFAGFKEDATDAFSGIGDEIARETKLARQLEQKLQDLTKAQVLLDIQRVAAKRRIKELNKEGEDTTKTIDERIAKLQEAANLEEKLSKKQLKISEEKLANALGEIELTEEATKKIEEFRQGTLSSEEAISSLGISESNLEDLEKFRDLFAEVENQQSELTEIGTTIQNKVNTLLREQLSLQDAVAKKRIDDTKKITDAAIKESQTRLDLYVAENAGKAKSLNDQLSFEKSVYDKKVELYKQQLDAKKLSQVEYDLLMIQSHKDLLQSQADLTIQHAQEEFDLYVAQNKSKTDINKLLTDNLVKQEEERLLSILEKQIEFYETQNQMGVISDQELASMKLAVQEQYETDFNDLHLNYKEQQKAYDGEQYNLQLMIDELRGIDKFARQQSDLDNWYTKETEAAKKAGKDTTKIDEYYALQSQKIDEEKFMAKMQGASTVFGLVSELLGKETAAGKAAAIAQATIDTLVTGVLAFKGMVQSIPGPIGIIAGALAAAGVVASGFKTVQKITSVNTDVPKAEHGAVFDIGGNRHSAGGTKFWGEDGTQFEAERDEKLFIMNRAASLAMGPGLSRMNQAYGGKSLMGSSNYLADGGMVARSLGGKQTKVNVSNTIDYDLLATKVAEKNGIVFNDAVSKLPNPVTDVRDIISEVDSYNEVVDYASW